MGIARVRWGIVATGNISTSFTRDLAELAGEAVVTAVASRSLDSADRFADQFGIEHRYDDYRRLLEDGHVDVLYIGTPHPQHYAIARAALQAKVAVLCEKPVTLTARQARDLVAVAHENNTLFAEAMWMRTHPVVQAFFADLAKGVIGEPMEALADFGFHKPQLPARLLDPALGGGALMDGGIYPITFVHMALGSPAELKAVGSVNEDGVDLNVAMAWRYDTGAIAALTCGLRSQNPWTASVSGPEGSLLLPHRFHHPEYYIRSTAAGEERIDVPTHGLGYHYEAAEVMRALRAGLVECPALPHAATIEILDLLDETRRQIGVSYPGDDEYLGG
ncbi:putative dehydrogenase [Kribbella orskensis]|uniref:Dehydrogenase n=1 Tax=Kribbella orskensis TaxID=2512216 RepID=A0ABY2BWD7_9ACTN|nr:MULTISPECIES: Gfo/Idh/MocA family oxidoreductase [Kribbella]TCN43940.1 putative dehydrogenase [Kribbella sp. VKM Ac-2500]TCO32282.1 putative dehydrogenase [Kribbella orskensis]